MSSGYGISGILANGDEFGPAEPNYPEGTVPSVPNIQAQKVIPLQPVTNKILSGSFRQAVALKALAGVALIGAAAALATNPVLLPIGIVSGRRKRSNLREGDTRMKYISRILESKSRRIGKL